MNLVLFEAAEIGQPLPRTDRRARHILEILRRNVGDTFDAGIVNGPRGKATLIAIADALTFAFAPTSPAPGPAPALTLVIGFSRPQTARDILRDATTLGATALHFVRTEKSDPSYAQSTLWSSDGWRRHLLAGAEQAFTTVVPAITHGRTLRDTLGSLPAAGAATTVALDNYDATSPLSQHVLDPDAPITLALGPERGWSASDRDLLRTLGFTFVHLGERVLRTESAVIAALAILRAKRGLM